LLLHVVYATSGLEQRNHALRLFSTQLVADCHKPSRFEPAKEKKEEQQQQHQHCSAVKRQDSVANELHVLAEQERERLWAEISRAEIGLFRYVQAPTQSLSSETGPCLIGQTQSVVNRKRRWFLTICSPLFGLLRLESETVTSRLSHHSSSDSRLVEHEKVLF
jgi:hypothetical protein